MHRPELTVAVTGASGALGKALLQRWHRRGARLIALTHSQAPLQLLADDGSTIPLQQLRWQVGQEQELLDQLPEVDVLVLNHGINLQQQRDAEATARSLEVNALSSWRLLEGFAARVAARSPSMRAGRPQPRLGRPATARSAFKFYTCGRTSEVRYVSFSEEFTDSRQYYSQLCAPAVLGRSVASAWRRTNSFSSTPSPNDHTAATSTFASRRYSGCTAQSNTCRVPAAGSRLTGSTAARGHPVERPLSS